MTVEDISFVIVARNEALAIRRCLDAVLALDRVDCEVICVDSASSDETPSIMRGYADRHPGMVVVDVPDCRNAAQARNAGKARASRRWIFFLDGDVEIYGRFLDAALRELTSGTAVAATGGLDEVLYADATGMRIGEPYIRRRFPERTSLMTCGGSFIVSRQIAEAAGDYDERFDRSQDLDYSTRVSALGELVGLPVQMGCHHTLEFRDRPWQHVKNGYVLCQGMLARKHWRRNGFWKDWLRTRKTYVAGLVLLLALVLCAGLALAGRLGWPEFLAGVGALLAVEIVYSHRRRQSLQATLVLHLISPPMVVWGFLVEPHTRTTR